MNEALTALDRVRALAVQWLTPTADHLDRPRSWWDEQPYGEELQSALDDAPYSFFTHGTPQEHQMNEQPSIIPIESTDPTGPRPGDWVQVWGQILDKPTHPDDVVVEFFSHNEQFHNHIARDRIEATGSMPDFVSQCNALLQIKPNRLARCTLHHGHNKDAGHLGPKGETWTDRDSFGYIEEA